jgi:hypothetical protein
VIVNIGGNQVVDFLDGHVVLVFRGLGIRDGPEKVFKDLWEKKRKEWRGRKGKE